MDLSTIVTYIRRSSIFQLLKSSNYMPQLFTFSPPLALLKTTSVRKLWDELQSLDDLVESSSSTAVDLSLVLNIDIA